MTTLFPEKMRAEKEAVVKQSWAPLAQAMEAAGINTPPRIAAFLTTVAYESNCEYNRREDGDTRLYGGRGHIQLTLKENYQAAGNWLGVDLVTNPEWARSLQWSAKIATWYWTKARPKCNEYADNLQMGKICGAIGYPLGDGSEDRRRCQAFIRVLKFLTGVDPVGVVQTR